MTGRGRRKRRREGETAQPRFFPTASFSQAKTADRRGIWYWVWKSTFSKLFFFIFRKLDELNKSCHNINIFFCLGESLSCWIAPLYVSGTCEKKCARKKKRDDPTSALSFLPQPTEEGKKQKDFFLSYYHYRSLLFAKKLCLKKSKT